MSEVKIWKKKIFLEGGYVFAAEQKGNEGGSTARAFIRFGIQNTGMKSSGIFNGLDD